MKNLNNDTLNTDPRAAAGSGVYQGAYGYGRRDMVASIAMSEATANTFKTEATDDTLRVQEFKEGNRMSHGTVATHGTERHLKAEEHRKKYNEVHGANIIGAGPIPLTEANILSSAAQAANRARFDDKNEKRELLEHIQQVKARIRKVTLSIIVTFLLAFVLTLVGILVV